MSRRWWARVLRLLAGRDSGAGSGSGAGAVAARRNALFAYTAASIVVGMGLLAWTTVAVPIHPAIDPGLPGTTLEGPTGGLLLWLLFGLLGSVRVLRTPDGAHITFHMPFIGAALLLGGPTAGAWVAFLSTIERRELESQPWYGILANHAVLAIAAIAGGVAADLTAALLEPGALTVGAGSWGAPTFIAATVGLLVLASVATAMGAVTVVLRDGLTRGEFVSALLGMVGRLNALEIGLAMAMALAYVAIGWWTPAVIGIFVLIVWDNHPVSPPDPLTGLQRSEAFHRRLDGGLGQMRRGLAPGATFMSLDLDEFHPVNNTYGHAVGDEVLREIGIRLLAQARRLNDVAGRLGGDEFALFFGGLVDEETAMRRAMELHQLLCKPVATSAGLVSVGASIGVVVLDAWGGTPSTSAVLRRGDQAMFHAKFSGGGVHLWDPDDPPPFAMARTKRRR